MRLERMHFQGYLKKQNGGECRGRKKKKKKVILWKQNLDKMSRIPPCVYTSGHAYKMAS